MTAVLPILLGVMLLSGPDEESVDRGLAARIAAEADSGMRAAKPAGGKDKGARITSVRSDFDREEGVVMFDGNVCVEYAADYVMHADRLFVFMGGSNELSRIVALGGVVITNDTRTGSCAMAKFWKRTSEIEMYGDGKDVAARFSDANGGNDLQGSMIRFWLDSEQVDVENPQIHVDGKSGGKIL